jgi:hypothetical protein
VIDYGLVAWSEKGTWILCILMARLSVQDRRGEGVKNSCRKPRFGPEAPAHPGTSKLEMPARYGNDYSGQVTSAANEQPPLNGGVK